MMLECGCVQRKITKSEKEDYPEGTDFILDKICEKHQRQVNEELMEPMTKEERFE